MKSPLPDDEAERRAAIRQYEIIDTEPEPAFDDLARLAAHICGVAIALINLIDGNRQWFTSKLGVDISEMPRDLGICPQCIEQGDVLVIPDTLADSRFATNPVVTTYPHIRFYAGVPLITPTGLVIGTLCVADTVPHQLSLAQVDALQALGRQIISQLELRRHLADLKRIAEDITECKFASEQIREQATLLDKSPDAIFVLDTDNCIRFCNQSAQRLYGCNAKEIVGCASEVLFNDSPQIQQARQTVFATGKWHGELRQVTKNGKEILVESRWTLVQNQEDKPKSILIVNTDITDKKQLEAQFQRIQRMESLGTLAGGMAHDLNNILTPILTSVQILEMVVNDERSQRLLKLLETNAKRGANLIKQLLYFARGTEVEMAVIQVVELIEKATKVVKKTFPNSINLTTITIGKLWAISGDATQLHQVLINLCVNARDAMPNGGSLNIAAENITIDAHYAKMNIDAKVGRYVVITIADTGCGIPPEIIDKIFEPFFTTKEIGKGSGLGLSTVMGIIKGHGGFINAYSEVGKGTRFKVYLPAQETREIKSSNSAEKIVKGNGELILVVDDEVGICDVNKASLEAYNYQVVTANDGLDAIALYAQHKNDISAAIVDMMMPCMDGLTTIRTLQKINPQVKIIASSGLFSNVMTAELASTGIKTFLSKPYTAEQLLKSLHKVIANG